jgi:hypothetical protein
MSADKATAVTQIATYTVVTARQKSWLGGCCGRVFSQRHFRLVRIWKRFYCIRKELSFSGLTKCVYLCCRTVNPE